MSRRAQGVVLLALAGCDRSPAALDPAAPLSSRSIAPSPSIAPVASIGPVAPSARRPAVGGAWVGCIAGFRRSGRPVDDAERLGARCGQGLGMARIGAWQGELRDGWTGELPLRPGDCVRLIAVGSDGVTSLALSLIDEAGRVVTRDGSDDGWPVVPPDGTTCVVTGGRYTVQATARPAGSGSFAASAWRLP